MNGLALYRVVGTRDYRGHEQGSEFAARLDPRAARRAIDRGSIVCLGAVVLEPQDFTFPEGWLSGPHETSQPRRREAPLS